jgi:hypothetical protein
MAIIPGAAAGAAVFNQATRTGYAAADLIVTTSKGVADDLVDTFGVRRENIAVVPNPVDVELSHAPLRSRSIRNTSRCGRGR